MGTLSVLLSHFDLGLLLHLFVVDAFVLAIHTILFVVLRVGLLQPPEITILLSLNANWLDTADQTKKQQTL